MSSRFNSTVVLGLGFSAAVLGAARPLQVNASPTIRRTEFGVPHIIATDFRGIGIGLGYAQTEDYGERVLRGLVRDKGWMGRTFGRDSMASDFAARLVQARVEETYHLLEVEDATVLDHYVGADRASHEQQALHRAFRSRW